MEPMFYKFRMFLTMHSVMDLIVCRKSQDDLEKNARAHMVQDSMEVLRMNDRGGYTVPAENLYPFQVRQILNILRVAEFKSALPNVGV